jgi:hypothetical protein
LLTSDIPKVVRAMGSMNARCGTETEVNGHFPTVLLQYEREDIFFCNIVTGDGGKRQSVRYRHKGSPAPKQFKTAPSAGTIMLTAFWDVNGGVHSECLLAPPLTLIALV